MNASNTTRHKLVIAVDGPSGSGKSSISKTAAKQLGFNFLDTGAMYRAVTWFYINNAAELTEDIGQNKITINISIEPDIEKISVNSTDVTRIIREDLVTSQVSKYAAIPEIRNFLVKKQRELVNNSEVGIFVEGRDIGSVVLPNADCKIYITASDEVRAQRRALQNNSDSQSVLEAQRERDLKDSTRQISPLLIPDDARILDNSELNFEESVKKIISIVSEVKK